MHTACPSSRCYIAFVGTQTTIPLAWFQSVLNVPPDTSVADPGCLSRIRIFSSRFPDPNFFHPGSRDVSKLSEIWSWLFIPDPDPDFLPIPDPGSMGQKSTESRIRISNTAWYSIWILVNVADGSLSWWCSQRWSPPVGPTSEASPLSHRSGFPSRRRNTSGTSFSWRGISWAPPRHNLLFNSVVDPAFFLITDPDPVPNPGFWWPEENIQYVKT